MRRMGQVGQGDSFEDMFRSIPFVTKILVISTILSAAAVSFGFASAESFIFYWPFISKKFEIWRFLTSFVFVGGFSFNFLMHTFILYENCKRYETNPWNTGAGGTSADFLWMVIIGIATMSFFAYFFQIMVLSEPLLYMIMYLWSRREPDAQLNIWGFRFQGLYLPWVYIAIRVLMGGSATLPLLGVGVGHLYFFLIEVLPATHQLELIRTPKIIVDIVDKCSQVTQSPSPASSAFQVGGGGGGGQPGGGGGFPQTGAGRAWGRGRVLGTS